MHTRIPIGILLISGLVSVGNVAIAQSRSAQEAKAARLDRAFADLQLGNFVDLTHSFAPGIPHWRGFTNETVKTLYSYNQYGFLAQEFSLPGQWGTHLDAPVHFVKGKRTLDAIRPDELFLRLVVIDVHEKVFRDPDYAVTMADVNDWEQRNGLIPAGAFVALRTDWSKRWPNQKAMQNVDQKGESHYPGWSLPVLKYLYETRNITASGHETTDTEPGVQTTKNDYSLETYILGSDHYQIEMLTNLDKLPEKGALLMVGVPKVKDGTGFPVRAIAILP